MLLDRGFSREEFEALSDAEYAAMNSSIYNPNKDRSKIEAIAGIILEEGFDFVGLCEVGGLETLENFHRVYLGNRYECRLYQENSRRGIFVGALVKKGRFGSIVARNVGGTYSRNLLELNLSGDGRTLRVFIVHLKSQYGQDHGLERRIEEVKQLSSLVDRHDCVVMGDFNGIAIRGHAQFEFEPFLELPFRDVLEAMDVPVGARFSHFYFNAGAASFSQLDYIFCSNDITILDGRALADMVPINYAQRRRLPSDHVFLTATIALSERRT